MSCSGSIPAVSFSQSIQAQPGKPSVCILASNASVAACPLSSEPDSPAQAEGFILTSQPAP